MTEGHSCGDTHRIGYASGVSGSKGAAKLHLDSKVKSAIMVRSLGGLDIERV